MMSTPSEVFSGTDIDFVRVLLGQAGRIHHVIQKNEPQIAISTSKLYTNFKDLTDVVGVWSGSDFNHSGTSLMLSGTFNSKKGELYQHSGTATPLVLGADYLVTYAHGDGLSDREIQRAIDDATQQVNLFLYDPAVTFDTTTIKGKMTYALKINIASLNAIGILNMGNIIQSGFNYALGELRIETKLWGEGMSTESLLMRLETKINGLLDMLKLYYSDLPLIQVLDRSKGEPRYDKGRMGHLLRHGSVSDWVMDGITISRSFRVINDDGY